MTKVMSMMTFISSGKDPKSVLTCLLILGIEFTLFKGRKILRVLNEDKFYEFNSRSSIKPETATKKSKTFHASLR